MYDIPQRPRRNRQSGAVRDLVRETHLTPGHLIMPLFVLDGQGRREEIASMPGVFRLSEDEVLKEVGACMRVGIRSFVLFPAVEEELKTSDGSYGADPSNFYLRIARSIKATFAEVMLMSDVALDPYSSDGHDGLVVNGEIVNDATLPLLAAQAVAQAEAGFDFIGPSDMMDGRVGLIREALDKANFTQTGIIAYSAKYASAFYGPFRDALESAPKSGDKKTYQMDPANRHEALREAELDAEEGADFLMVKPALCYLDVIRDLSVHMDRPIAAYNVSGEFSMLKAAAAKGWIDYDRAMPEMLTSIHRAGASVIITYFAREFAERYQAGNIPR
ncbi:MAG: porphobilinogen synthase [Flavobacteriales bacterium]|nr:porphobilinogen synthase [Flavobacteriales bacterium]